VAIAKAAVQVLLRFVLGTVFHLQEHLFTLMRGFLFQLRLKQSAVR